MSLPSKLRPISLVTNPSNLFKRGLASHQILNSAPTKYIIGGIPREHTTEEDEDEGPIVSNRYFGPKSNFVDFKRVQVVGGKGGDGAVSFLRDKITSDGPPNGGNGGGGGNVVFKASKNESTLSIGKYRLAGNKGLNGQGSSMHGQRGEDLIVTVPVGTVVREIDPPCSVSPSGVKDYVSQYTEQLQELEEDYSVHYKIYPAFKKELFHYPTPRALKRNAKPKTKVNLDLDEEGMHIVAYGGRGGYGNPHFSSQLERSGMIAERGFEGETRYLELEFKSLADCGLVGLPNAGKSTFLGAVSNAHPKIAPYPFTTINPYLGTIDYLDLFQMTLADIPGLIPGAHLNRGLGHSFLRHVERSKALVYIIDLSLPAPHLDFLTLRSELELYKPGLSEKPSLIVANKADLPSVGPHTLHEFKRLLPPGIQVVTVSAMLGKNVSKATLAMRNLVESSR